VGQTSRSARDLLVPLLLEHHNLKHSFNASRC